MASWKQSPNETYQEFLDKVLREREASQDHGPLAPLTWSPEDREATWVVDPDEQLPEDQRTLKDGTLLVAKQNFVAYPMRTEEQVNFWTSALDNGFSKKDLFNSQVTANQGTTGVVSGEGFIHQRVDQLDTRRAAFRDIDEPGSTMISYRWIKVWLSGYEVVFNGYQPGRALLEGNHLILIHPAGTVDVLEQHFDIKSTK